MTFLSIIMVTEVITPTLIYHRCNLNTSCLFHLKLLTGIHSHTNNKSTLQVKQENTDHIEQR